MAAAGDGAEIAEAAAVHDWRVEIALTFLKNYINILRVLKIL